MTVEHFIRDMLMKPATEYIIYKEKCLCRHRCGFSIQIIKVNYKQNFNQIHTHTHTDTQTSINKIRNNEVTVTNVWLFAKTIFQCLN